MGELLELTGLTYKAGSSNIIDNLNFSMKAQEVHSLLGTNGTGKSTLAHLIMGCREYTPTSGEIVFEGQVINDFPIHERARLGITMAWQEPVRFEGIATSDYLTIQNPDSDRAYFLQMVGLHPALYLNRMVDKSLSGGERKRIELASILALKPKLAILDEPDSGIDMLSTQDIINVINSFRDHGSSVLIITHREEIALVADRASQLCKGKIICTGNPENVAEYYKSKQCLVCNGEVCVSV
jgi:Fe-S cluster assembly ATP-binding protein